MGIDASVDSMAVKTRSLGIALTTAYNISQPSTAKSFNLDTVTSTINTLLSSYEGGSVQDIQSAVASVGKLLESSFQENTQENSATTTSVFCAFDYDPVWDEIVATIEMTTFDFTLSTWKTVSKKKGTKSETDRVDAEYSVYSKRQGVNLYRLTSATSNYQPVTVNLSSDGESDDPVGPSGNVVTINAPGAQMKPLPKPSPRFAKMLRADPTLLNDMIQPRVQGLKVIRE